MPGPGRSIVRHIPCFNACAAMASKKAPVLAGRRLSNPGEEHPATWVLPYLVMSTSLVSGRNSVPITRVIAAITIGYHRPW